MKEADAPRRLPVTAIVASRNEAHLLERSLPRLAFCDELIVIDVSSSDATAEVAEACGARAVRWPPVPIAEVARAEVAAEARHDWLLFTDPDELLPAALADALAAVLESVAEDVALVWAPIRFRFAGRPLRGTIWGGRNHRRLLARRSGVDLRPSVFGGTRLLDGSKAVHLPWTEETAIDHDWVTGYRDWIGKHRRYFGLERRERLRRGDVTGYRALVSTPFRAFADCFVRHRGHRDWLRGLALSLLWAAYRTAGELALLLDLRRAARGRAAR